MVVFSRGVPQAPIMVAAAIATLNNLVFIIKMFFSLRNWHRKGDKDVARIGMAEPAAFCLTLNAMENLTYISPFFIVANLQRSISFYVDVLGFEIKFMGPDGDPFFAIVGRDVVSIFLKEITPDIKPMPNHSRHEWARWDAYVSTLDPDVLFEEFQNAGVNFHRPLRNDEDGLRGFEVMDADGYVLFFGRPN